MSRRLPGIVWWTTALVAGGLACGGVSSDNASLGGVRQGCYANGTCNQGLVCLSQLCVAVDGDDDAGDGVDGGSTGGDGDVVGDDTGGASDTSGIDVGVDTGLHDAAAPESGFDGGAYASCVDWQMSGQTTDGDYVITPDVSEPSFSVYCYDMGEAGAAVEYLDVTQTPVTANATNFFTTGTVTTTTFAKVRLVLSPLAIDRNDRTFATVTANNGTPNPDVRCLRFASAGSYVAPNDMSGTGNIDLTGTPFRIAESVAFIGTGYMPACVATFSTDRKSVALEGGGFAGWCNTGPDPNNDPTASVNRMLPVEFSP